MAGEKAYCIRCKTETPPLVKPIFEGFEKVGETKVCPFCGEPLQGRGGSAPATAQRPRTSAAGLFADYAPPAPVNPFGDGAIEPPKASNPFGGKVSIGRPVNPFGDDAAGGPLRICSNCRSYVVNPFTQKCMLHEREVTATDSCPDFQPRPR
jgi:hypothetical protein